MKTALSLAARNVGRTGLNPSVGALVVKDGVIIGRGVTAKGGRPHAEPQALAMAGDSAKGADLYVTLEPCCHHGQTPPCTDAIIKAGIKRAIISAGDSDPRVKNKSVQILKDAGIEVITDVLEKEGREANKGFFSRFEKKRPYITLKLATSLDGKIALQNGVSKWITGPAAREYGHLLRARNDAILTGINTILKDDPELSCRLSGLEEYSPIRVILDSDLKISLTSKIIKTGEKVPTIIFSSKEGQAGAAKVIKVNAGLDIEEIVRKLAELGINNLLIEAGGKIAGSFIKNDLVDEIAWFVAPKIIGAEGIQAIARLELENMGQIPGFIIAETRKIGEDMFFNLRKNDQT